MKNMKNEKIKIDGTYSTTKVVETNPNDGFVHQADINKTDMNNYGTFHKGYQKNISITTNDPRITRPVVNAICGIFFVIGILMMFVKSYIFGLLFILVSVFSFFKAKEDIDNIEKELVKNSNYNKNDKTVIKEFLIDVSRKSNEVVSSVFTKNTVKNFIKVGILIYTIVSIICIILISIFINIFLGLFLLIILILIGLFFYVIASKIGL